MNEKTKFLNLNNKKLT